MWHLVEDDTNIWWSLFFPDSFGHNLLPSPNRESDSFINSDIPVSNLIKDIQFATCYLFFLIHFDFLGSLLSAHNSKFQCRNKRICGVHLNITRRRLRSQWLERRIWASWRWNRKIIGLFYLFIYLFYLALPAELLSETISWWKIMWTWNSYIRAKHTDIKISASSYSACSALVRKITLTAFLMSRLYSMYGWQALWCLTPQR